MPTKSGDEDVGLESSDQQLRTDFATSRDHALHHVSSYLHGETLLALVDNDNPALDFCGLEELLVNPATRIVISETRSTK